VKGVQFLSFRFERPPILTLPFCEAPLKSIRTKFEIKGCWIAKKVNIDATTGLYDWIRRTIRIGPGAGRIVFKGVPIGSGGSPIERPPDFQIYDPRQLQDGEISFWVLELSGFDRPNDVPNLDQFVVAEDLEPIRSDLPRESYFS
jgi:hypothetical protein